jgi:anaerobic magnesium-protoporphyrin IX monomethyl ester cyclase
MKRVLLLNPPGHEKYFRDNYCSPTSKAGYYWQPTDLLVQSGHLAAFYELDIVDAIVENLSPDYILDLVKKNEYYAILALSGTASWDQDLQLLEQIRAFSPNSILALSGNIALFEYQWVFKNHEYIDACLLDYTTDDFLNYLNGERESLTKIVYKDETGNMVVKDGRLPKQLNYPVPLHHKFKNHLYHFPLSIKHPSAIIITSAGCPHKCEFCVASVIPYRFRDVDDVVEELSVLQSMGIKEVFFQDFMFDVKRERTIKLCQTIIERGINLSWYCSCRVDTLDEEVLVAMRDAGCHTIQFGIESTEQEALDNQKKKTNKPNIREITDLCNKVGIKVFGHFIIGLPGETENSMLNQGKYAREIGCYNAVFNTLVADVGTPLREKAVIDGKIDGELTIFSNSDKNFAVSLNDSNAKKLEHIRKKVMLDFYLHPRFIWNNFVRTRSIYELKQKLKFGISVLLNI